MKQLLALPQPGGLLKAWNSLKRMPGGKFLFSKLIGLAVPYSGSIRPRLVELGPGRAVLEMRDRRKVRNHLSSIHAIAMVNLAELTSGLAMVCGIPDDARCILTAFSIEYKKKARGTLVGRCDFEPPSESSSREYEVNVSLNDSSGEVVATATARWLVGPKISK